MCPLHASPGGKNLHPKSVLDPVNSGPPHISEAVRARTFEILRTFTSGQVHFFGINFFSPGSVFRVRVTGPPTLFWDPLISRKLIERES